jgi:hypothetical protein
VYSHAIRGEMPVTSKGGIEPESSQFGGGRSELLSVHDSARPLSDQ